MVLMTDVHKDRPLLSTVAGWHRHEIVIKKSRFIATAAHVTSKDDADKVIHEVRHEFYDARHHCVALSVGMDIPEQRSSDDGEPSGTAGIPMLEVLRARSLSNVVVVVSRYFGGVLLGASGLVRAYSSATSEVLDQMQVVEHRWVDVSELECDHALAGRVENFLREWLSQNHGTLVDVRYQSNVSFVIESSHTDDLNKILASELSGKLRAIHVDRVIR